MPRAIFLVVALMAVLSGSGETELALPFSDTVVVKGAVVTERTDGGRRIFVGLPSF